MSNIFKNIRNLKFLNFIFIFVFFIFSIVCIKEAKAIFGDNFSDKLGDKFSDKFSDKKDSEPFIAKVDMRTLILPGTASYFSKSLKKATEQGAKAVIVYLDTMGGVLHSAQKIVKEIFDSKIPVVVFITPDGASATSAGVFITLSADVAAMSRGTSIGSAHPVAGSGQDIKGDMREKVENMTVAMIKSIAETRDRNTKWAKEAVQKSVSITASKALEINVIDFIADDTPSLLKTLEGRVIKFKNKDFSFKGFSNLPIKEYEMSMQDKMLNVLSDPSIAVLLWLGAVFGLALELYNPGAIFPGLLGSVCLILAMIVNQVIPISVGALILIIAGFLMIVIETHVSGGLFGIFGVIAITIGSLSLVDLSNFPELSINPWVILPSIIALALFFILVAASFVKAMGRKAKVGFESLIGVIGTITVDFTSAKNSSVNKGTVFLDGAYWSAVSSESIKKGDRVIVVGNESNLVLKVVKVENKVENKEKNKIENKENKEENKIEK
ncbi:MAG: NfeD family protein [Bdellovibrionota bacterium]